MSDQLCPNCRRAVISGEAGCPRCGWLPLRSTELQFLDDDLITCPKCKSQRERSIASCPECGTASVLQPLAPGRVTFHISTLLAITTMVAICAAILRFTIVGGVVVSVILGLSILRVTLLLRERKKHDYPAITLQRTAELFGASFGGVLLAPVIFGAVSLGGGMLLSMLGAIFYHLEMVGFFIMLCILLAMNVALTYWTYRRAPRRNYLIAGGVHALIFSLALLYMSQTTFQVPMWFEASVVLVGVISLALAMVALLCWRGGSARLANYVCGHLVTINVLGIVYLCLYRGFLGDSVAVPHFALSLFLLPTLLTNLALKQLWSWDDAFPITDRQPVRFQQPGRPSSPQLPLGESSAETRLMYIHGNEDNAPSATTTENEAENESENEVGEGPKEFTIDEASLIEGEITFQESSSTDGPTDDSSNHQNY